jgi:predicted porin
MTKSMNLGGCLALTKGAVLLTMLASAGLAQAENAQNPLTWNGFTFYSTVDVGASYQSHGRPMNDYYSAGVYYFPNKAATDSTSQFSNNGLSQSTLGLRGQWEFAQGWSGLFKMESAINPISLKMTDSQKALTQNNGKPITEQEAAADNSLTGPFSMALYAGIKADIYGQLTFGRQNTPLKDNIYRYDPLSNAGAFSAFGAFGTPAGGGSTENARLNNSIRYQNTLWDVRVDAIYANGTSSQGGQAWQLGLGSKLGGFTVDGVYAEKKGALVAASLGIDGTSATSVRWLTRPKTSLGYSYAAPGSVSINDALVGTASDNRAWGLFAKYDFGGPVLSGGFERITYSNP